MYTCTKKKQTDIGFTLTTTTNITVLSFLLVNNKTQQDWAQLYSNTEHSERCQREEEYAKQKLKRSLYHQEKEKKLELEKEVKVEEEVQVEVEKRLKWKKKLE